MSTGSKGHCVTFSYAISGLSADRLRVLLHPVNLDEDPDTPNFNNDVVLATLIDDTRDDWKHAQVLYTYPEEHTVLFTWRYFIKSSLGKGPDSSLS